MKSAKQTIFTTSVESMVRPPQENTKRNHAKFWGLNLIFEWRCCPWTGTVMTIMRFSLYSCYIPPSLRDYRIKAEKMIFTLSKSRDVANSSNIWYRFYNILYIWYININIYLSYCMFCLLNVVGGYISCLVYRSLHLPIQYISTVYLNKYLLLIYSSDKFIPFSCFDLSI